MALFQIVRESDGTFWKQEVRWDGEDFGFVGHSAPQEVTGIPDGAKRLDVAEMEWEPVSGCTVVAAWIVGE